MASQSDDFARMIQLLEQILERLPPRVDPTPYPVGHPFGLPGCPVCHATGVNLYSCGMSGCPYGIVVDTTGTGDYVCPTCAGGVCQCKTGDA